MDKNVIDHVFFGKWRMNRRQYWNVMILISILINISNFVIIFVVWSLYYPALLWINPIFIFSLWSIICIGTLIRRWHDLNLPTRFTVVWFSLNFIIIILDSIFQLSIIFWLSILILFYPFMLAFKPWKEVANQYWEQPKDLKKVSEIIRFWWTGKS